MAEVDPHNRRSAESDSGIERGSLETAERKRLAARRRFLVGGAAAVPVVLTFGHRQAHAAGMSVCVSQIGFPGQGGGVKTFVCELFPGE